LRVGRERSILGAHRRMAIVVAGISHHGAALAVREKIAYRAAELLPTLDAIRGESGLREAVLLSTCNRTEFYVVEGDRDAVPSIWSTLSNRLGSDASGYGYVRRDRDAIAHLFRVGAGLDSLVRGDRRQPHVRARARAGDA